MTKKNTSEPETFIEINGKRYNARRPQPATEKKVISDVTAVKPLIPLPSKPIHQASDLPKPATPHKKVMDIRPVQHVKPRQQQHSNTLMRSAVRKPAPGTKLHATTRTDILAKAPAAVSVLPKISFTHTDPKREAHAKRIARSELIQRFSPNDFAPSDIFAPSSTSQQEAAAVVISAPSPISQPSLDIFERALAKADAHTELPLHAKKLAREAKKQARRAHHASKKRPLHHRTSTILSASVIVLALFGFVAYQNRTAITLRYASAKAGFHANLPSYKPAGFTVGKLSYGAGNVSTAFSNPRSNQRFTLSEAPSTWDSETLFEQAVATSGKPYQVLQRGGHTVYVFSDNSALWVSGGVLYELGSQTNLSTSQVLDLAGSV